jgi:hypothetical protein
MLVSEDETGIGQLHFWVSRLSDKNWMAHRQNSSRSVDD